MSTAHRRTISADRDNVFGPSGTATDGRLGASTAAFSTRGSFEPTIGTLQKHGPEARPSTANRVEEGRFDYFGQYDTFRTDLDEADERDASEYRQLAFRDQIQREEKIKLGSENLLDALSSKSSKHTKDQRLRVEDELKTSSKKIAQLKQGLQLEIQRSREPLSSLPRASQLTGDEHVTSTSDELYETKSDEVDDSESPTFALAELLQSLEADGLPPDYYVEHANNLIELFKRHPTLKYDLVWSIFGLRVQGMLLSDSREIVAAGYRIMRYAITDRRSLQIMRSFQTDLLVMISLIKDGKASIEREQALKYVRAFLDVKGGVHEISNAIVRVIVALAEHSDDRMKNICILTLSEILVKSPALVFSAGGMGLLADVLAEGFYQPSSSLTFAFLFLLEAPERRKYLTSGYEIAGAFAIFGENHGSINESRLRTNASVISSLLKTWQGLITLAKDDYISLKSLMASLYLSSSSVKSIILEILLDVLHISTPSWSSSFLAGRRLTTYNAIPSITSERLNKAPRHTSNQHKDMVDQFRAATLAAFLESGMLQSLQHTVYHDHEPSVRRKATLLLGECLHLADKILPTAWASKIQVLPRLFGDAMQLGLDERYLATATIYQIDSVNRTLLRSKDRSLLQAYNVELSGDLGRGRKGSELNSNALTFNTDESVFRSAIMETQVINTPNYLKWKWDLIQKIVEGPLLDPKRVEEAFKGSKFLKRLIGFYRPFKYRFSDIRNTRPNQRYVRVGCTLIKTLLQTAEGVRYLADNKLLRQIAECLAQVDRLSGLTSTSPLLSAERLSETLTGGYFALLGVMSSYTNGLLMLERWKMINMFYHIVDLQFFDELVKALLGNMDYTLDSHLRIVLSKALTSSSKNIRIFSTQLLRKYATLNVWDPMMEASADKTCAQWAIDLLVMQLYDPDIEVCEVAIRNLEEACDDSHSLEYVVQCRPALDHLGEIGAPLLLRFLSTSIGYQYLDDLDYISREMDDWFLGRNDAYVHLIEASIAHALTTHATSPSFSSDQERDEVATAIAPPHFYRELTRTVEGCRLLEEKGHFEEFVNIIRTWGLEASDPEIIVKIKGSLWALANIGSMELGAPFFELSDAVELIIKIAEHSQVLSVRGTAVFALGLISRSIYGQEIIAEQKWDTRTDDLGISMGICLPQDIGKLFCMESWVSPGQSSRSQDRELVLKQTVTIYDEDLQERVMNLVKDLGNTVLSKRRAAELLSIRSRNSQTFNVGLLQKVILTFERHHFHLSALRFVMDLFDKSVIRQLVLDEAEAEEQSAAAIDETRRSTLLPTISKSES